MAEVRREIKERVTHLPKNINSKRKTALAFSFFFVGVSLENAYAHASWIWEGLHALLSSSPTDQSLYLGFA